MSILRASPFIWLLLIGAVVIPTIEVIRSSNSQLGAAVRRCGGWFRTYWIAVLVVIAVAGALLFGLPFVANHCVDITGPNLKFWLQTLAGNWSPDSFPAFSQTNPNAVPETVRAVPTLSYWQKYWFAVSAILAFLLNNAIILYLMLLVWRLASGRRRLMDFAHAVKNRDAIVRTTIRTAFGRAKELNDAQKSEMARIARDAFNAGVREWEDTYLELAVDPDEAKRLREFFQTPPPSQR